MDVYQARCSVCVLCLNKARTSGVFTVVYSMYLQVLVIHHGYALAQIFFVLFMAEKEHI